MSIEREARTRRTLRENAELKGRYFLELIAHGRDAAACEISPNFTKAIADADTMAVWSAIEARCAAGIPDETLCPLCFFIYGEHRPLAHAEADQFSCDVCPVQAGGNA